MDVWFWFAVGYGTAATTATWLAWSKALSQRMDLDIAEEELCEAHATIDRLMLELQSLPVRGPNGRLAKRIA